MGVQVLDQQGNLKVRDPIASPGYSGVSLQLGSTQAITTATITSVQWQTELWDTDDYWDSGTNTDIVIPETGKYHVTATIDFEANATGYREIRFYVNGTLKRIAQLGGWSGADTAFTHSKTLDLVKGDILTIRVHQTSGGNLNIWPNHSVVTVEPVSGQRLYVTPVEIRPNQYEINPIMNGDFRFDQRGTSFTGAANIFTLDRWNVAKVGDMVFDVFQSTDVPAVADSYPFSLYSMHFDCTTIDSSLTTNDIYGLRQRIEGNNIHRLAQRGFYIRFWVKSSKTGVHCVRVANAPTPDRSVVAEYTVNAVDTWEYKIVTIPASPSAGTWDYGTGTGFDVFWTLAAGPTWQTSNVGVWQTGNFTATPNQVNLADNVANNFRIAQVDIQPLLDYLPPYIPPDYTVEELRCFRYYWRGSYAAQGAWTSSTDALLYWTFPVPMRVTPDSILLDTSPIILQVRTDTGGSAEFTGSSSTIANTGGTNRHKWTAIDGFTGAIAGSHAFVGASQIGTDMVAFDAEL